jgi:O-antigen ligase
MTAAVSALYRPQLAPQIAEFIKPSIDRRTLGEICLCAGPSLAATAAGAPAVGAAIYFSILFAIFAVHLLTRQPHRFLALLIGTIPPMMIFRGYFFYNSPQILFATGLILIFELQRPAISRLWRDPLMKSLILGTLVYWLIGVALTGSYVPNFRGLELAFAVSALYVLGRRRTLLCTALLGIGISVILQGAALLRFGTRLGMAEIEGQRIGNPISFGVPAAFIFLLSILYKGEWLLLRNHPVWRFLITMMAAMALLLSTSRGSWMAAFGGVFLIYLANPEQRKLLIVFAAVIVIGALLFTHASQGSTLGRYLERTFSTTESWSKLTTGRSEQWAAIPHVLADSPVWGFGPGSGRDISRQYSGHYLIWHALYLQIAAETGLIGLSFLLLFFVAMFRRAVRELTSSRTVVPLMGAVCYSLIALTIQGLDAASGLFLALALMRRDGALFRLRRTV